MSDPYGGIRRSYANQSHGLTGLPGATIPQQQNYGNSLKVGARDYMNVDDIDGTLPRRMVGYTGARPDVLMQKELQQDRNDLGSSQLYASQKNLMGVNQLPAGYNRRAVQEMEQYTQSKQPAPELQPSASQHFQQYEQRLLRTDDIKGAQPKQYGNTVNQGMVAGINSGNNKAYRNDSEIFRHLYDNTHGGLRGSASQPNLQRGSGLPFNPQFQTSYMQQYAASKDAKQDLQLAKPLKPDMHLMFQGHRDIAGGLSGGEGIGNLDSTFKTTYQKNYNNIQDYQKQLEQEQLRKIQEGASQMKRDEPYISHARSPAGIGQNDYQARDIQATHLREEPQTYEAPKYGMDRDYPPSSNPLSRQDGPSEKDSYKPKDPDFLKEFEKYYGQESQASTLNEAPKQDLQRNNPMRASLIQNANSIIHGDNQLQQTLSKPNLEQYRQDQDYMPRATSQHSHGSIPNYLKGLSMAPTTDLGKQHEFIDHNIANRESLKYGSINQQYANIIPKLNDINYHRASQKHKYNFNVLTGSYVARPGMGPIN